MCNVESSSICCCQQTSKVKPIGKEVEHAASNAAKELHEHAMEGTEQAKLKLEQFVHGEGG
jgi:hypothetical protein